VLQLFGRDRRRRVRERVTSASNEIRRAAAAEGIGTAILLAAVTGSGVMAERLSDGNTALALLANSIATGGALVMLIFTFAPISGAHFNPLVTLVSAWRGSLAWRAAPVYIAAQVGGAIGGVLLAHLMFDLPLVQLSQRSRGGTGALVSEVVATFGLLAVIHGRGKAIPFVVAAYITAAYWFTASTSFANPAVTLARALTDSFVGIRAADVVSFIAAQCIGALAAALLFRWLMENRNDV
jgi:glycerol uptake facilitator-like aquaporin